MSEPFNSILEEIASELELRPLLTSIITRACELLGADGGSIGLYVPRRHTVQVEAIHQLPLTELGMEFEPGEGLIGKVLATGRPVIVDRYGELQRISLPEMRDYTVIGVPIHGPGGGLLGVFGIGAPPPRKFGTSDLDTLRLFARHAAIAIQNAMRYEREKRRTERMTLIAHIARVITAGLDANELIATAAQVIHEHLGYPNVVIPLLYRDEDGEEYLMFDGHAGNYGEITDLSHRMPVTTGVTGAAVRTRTPQIVNDVRKDPRYVPPPIPINVRTELAMPLVLGDEVFGCINIEGLNPFDDDDVASIQIIADHLAVAIKNTSLSREARQAAVMRERQRLARDLHDAVSQALSSISLMSQSIVPAWRRDPAEGERRARRIEELARLAFAEMRALLRELRPDPSAGLSSVENAGVGDVKRMGLAAALQRFAFILAPQTPSIRLDFAAYRSQSPSLEERLYLICREALSNAIRHSAADRLDVSAAVNDDVLMLSIQDNGRGFDVAARGEVPGDSPEQGIGLQSMSERAAALGGVCEVQSQSGRGTTVCIRIPLLATP